MLGLDGDSCRWLYMSRRSFLTVRRVFILCAALCFALTAFAYFKVFQIIRHQQKQVNTNESAFDMKKKITQFCTFLQFLILCFGPCLCFQIASRILQDYGEAYVVKLEYLRGFRVLFVVLNPLLYIWRINEIRDGARNIIRKLFCKRLGILGSLIL